MLTREEIRTRGLFGDGIVSAIDMSVDIEKVEDPTGVPRMELTLNGKWLQYKKF